MHRFSCVSILHTCNQKVPASKLGHQSTVRDGMHAGMHARNPGQQHLGHREGQYCGYELRVKKFTMARLLVLS